MKLELGAKIRKNHAPTNPHASLNFGAGTGLHLQAQADAVRRMTTTTVGGRMLTHVFAMGQTGSKHSGDGQTVSRR